MSATTFARRAAPAYLARFATLAMAVLPAAAVVTGCTGENKYVEPPPPEVTVANPSRRNVTQYIEATGTAESILVVEIRARVRGFLKECLVKEGAEVKEGQLMLVIDEEPFRVLLEQAQARLVEADTALQKAKQSKTREIVRAQLALDESQLEVAMTEEARLRQLVGTRTISEEELDRAVANRKKNEAQVEATKANLTQVDADYDTNISAAEANVAVAKTAVRNAEIDLGYCRITSPITGRIGRVFHDVGNLVGDGQSTLLTTVIKYDPIHVYTTLSVDDFLKYRGAAARSGEPEEQLPMELALANESGFQHTGHVDYYDPAVDRGTGTIAVRGIFDNPRGEILPGMFTRIRIPIDTRSDALLVPERALGIDQSGQYVLVVDSENKVEHRQVQVGQVEEDMRVVDGQIGPQDRVIVEGLLRARPGMVVVPHMEAAAGETGPATAGARTAPKQ